MRVGNILEFWRIGLLWHERPLLLASSCAAPALSGLQLKVEVPKVIL